VLNIFGFYTYVAKGSDVLYNHGAGVGDVALAADYIHVFDGTAEGEAESVNAVGRAVEICNSDRAVVLIASAVSVGMTATLDGERLAAKPFDGFGYLPAATVGPIYSADLG
jgi:acetyltransferase-like isoleucine patch superfamily enzyme